MTIEIHLWESENNVCPVREFVESIADPKASAKIVKVLDLLEEKGLDFMLKSKFIDKFKEEDLYEIRVEFNKIQYRIIGVFEKYKFYLLHGFIKKSQKTPNKDLKCAIQRSKILKNKRYEI